jgi:hypothetical protein
MSKINEILQEMDELKKKLRIELDKKIENKVFHKKWTFKEFVEYFKTIPIGTLLTSPIIYAMVIPAIILDVFLWIYQNINFRVYKIPLVKRSNYIFYDRQNLEYLHPIDKLGCVYCSYFNGLMAYSGEIASRTELYFCPIKHKKRLDYEHRYYKYFLPYGYNKYYEELENLRNNLRNYNFTDVKPENYGIKK